MSGHWRGVLCWLRTRSKAAAASVALMFWGRVHIALTAHIRLKLKGVMHMDTIVFLAFSLWIEHIAQPLPNGCGVD